jgi:hypothetical protein
VNSHRLELRATLIFLCLMGLFVSGCVHKIHVVPSPSLHTESPIPESLRVEVPSLAMEGPDHMPGIALLEWPAKDLRTAAIDYIHNRRTFSSVSEEQGSLTLTIKAWLWMRSRGEYRYTIRLESDLGPSGKPPQKSYLVQKEAVGSRVRWVTASDREPIEEAVQAALDELLLLIEEDGVLYGKRSN